MAKRHFCFIVSGFKSKLNRIFPLFECDIGCLLTDNIREEDDGEIFRT